MRFVQWLLPRFATKPSMNILQLSCSPRGRASESRRLARVMVDALLVRNPTATLIERDAGDGSIPAIDEDYADSQQSLMDLSEQGTAAVSDVLIRELDSADLVIIATPMHNYTVPATLKNWIDHVVRVRRSFDISPQGKVALLRDRPIFFAVSSGGRFTGERVRQPDFFRPYLKEILGMVGLHDLNFFTVEGTVFGPEALAEARAGAEHAIQEHFASRFG